MSPSEAAAAAARNAACAAAIAVAASDVMTLPSDELRPDGDVSLSDRGRRPSIT